MPLGSADPFEPIRVTQRAGWRPVVSARDACITHLAVATNAGQLKVGSFARSERTVKWNEVLWIGRTLGGRARFAGASRSMGSASVTPWRGGVPPVIPHGPRHCPLSD